MMLSSTDTLLTMPNPTPDTAWDNTLLPAASRRERFHRANLSPVELFRHDSSDAFAAFNQQAVQRRFGELD